MGMKARPKGRRLYAVLSNGEVSLFKKKPVRRVYTHNVYDWDSSGAYTVTRQEEAVCYDARTGNDLYDLYINPMCYEGWRKAGMPALKPDTITKIYVNKGE